MYISNMWIYGRPHIVKIINTYNDETFPMNNRPDLINHSNQIRWTVFAFGGHVLQYNSYARDVVRTTDLQY
jgi:hypothetical protein